MPCNKNGIFPSPQPRVSRLALLHVSRPEWSPFNDRSMWGTTPFHHTSLKDSPKSKALTLSQTVGALPKSPVYKVQPKSLSLEVPNLRQLNTRDVVWSGRGAEALVRCFWKARYWGKSAKGKKTHQRWLTDPGSLASPYKLSHSDHTALWKISTFSIIENVHT